ncbi:DegV domain-containing protein [Streptococcus salivarius]|nr:DegV domain-containing protein [Streptococcus salivarius]VUW85872.1 DegV domain-containing protein [Streptococcus thermophilus]
MSLAVITDSSVNLPADIQGHADVYILDIPVIIEGQPFVEGKNLDLKQFYAQMANSEELLKTSQPNLADLDNLLMELEDKGYTHVIGLFLSSGISGFWANSQFLIEDHAKLKIAFPDTKITASPMGAMVRNVLHWSAQEMSFDNILKKLDEQIAQTTAYILVDDLNHLVKGGRLSNGSAILGNLLSIKPILNFNDEGKIVVFEKVRTEKKAVKRLVALAKDNQNMELSILHTNAPEKAEDFKEQLEAQGVKVSTVVSLCAVIATHLGEGALVLGLTPKFTK